MWEKGYFHGPYQNYDVCGPPGFRASQYLDINYGSRSGLSWALTGTNNLRFNGFWQNGWSVGLWLHRVGPACLPTYNIPTLRLVINCEKLRNNYEYFPAQPSPTHTQERRRWRQHLTPSQRKAGAAPCVGSYWAPHQNGCFLWQINFQIDNIETGKDAQWKLAGVLWSRMTMDQWYHRIFSLSFFKTVTKKGWCYKDDDCSSWFFLG